MGSKQATKILLLKTYDATWPLGLGMTESFKENIRTSLPDAQLDICNVANGEALPDPAAYELVIVTGAPGNLLEEEQPEWVPDVLQVIRQIAGGSSETKLVGICWGHQAIHLALGGKLGYIGDTHRVSPLTQRRRTSRSGTAAKLGIDRCTRDRACRRWAEILPPR